MDEFSVYEPNNEEMELPPGFRFHPTDEELITHYLSPKTLQSSFCAKAIGEVDLNKVEPWDLPSIAKMGESEFYFFCLRDRKYPTGSRTNRATNAGFWKATGKDKEIYRCKNLIGMKKTLVFYQGRAPKGEKTNWVMHEYRSEGEYYSLSKPKNEWAISRVFCKSSGGKKTHISNLEPRTDCENVSQNLSLPPLMEYSGCYDQTSTMAVDPMSYSSYPTNEKKPREEMVDNSNDSLLFTESSFSDLIIPTQFTPNNQMVKDQSMMRYLVQNGRDLKTEFSVKSETKTDFGSVSSGLETGQGLDIDDINILRGPVDLDCLWDY